MWKSLVALVIVAALVLLLASSRTTIDRAQLLRRAGLVLMAAFTFVGAVWIAGEAFADPGGWRAAGLVAMWLVPLAVLLAISWYRVAWATVLLSVLTLGVVCLSGEPPRAPVVHTAGARCQHGTRRPRSSWSGVIGLGGAPWWRRTCQGCGRPRMTPWIGDSTTGLITVSSSA
jgi:hypothetical protein